MRQSRVWISSLEARTAPTSNRTWDFRYCNDINGIGSHCEPPAAPISTGGGRDQAAQGHVFLDDFEILLRCCQTVTRVPRRTRTGKRRYWHSEAELNKTVDRGDKRLNVRNHTPSNGSKELGCKVTPAQSVNSSSTLGLRPEPKRGLHKVHVPCITTDRLESNFKFRESLTVNRSNVQTFTGHLAIPMPNGCLANQSVRKTTDGRPGPVSKYPVTAYTYKSGLRYWPVAHDGVRLKQM